MPDTRALRMIDSNQIAARNAKKTKSKTTEVASRKQHDLQGLSLRLFEFFAFLAAIWFESIILNARVSGIFRLLRNRG